MHSRCSDVRNPSYPGYGGRGIAVCRRWESFDAFLEDMGECPKDYSLDRIDVNGNYEPGNCRWASKSEQSANRRPWTHTEDGLARLRENAKKMLTPEARAKAAEANRGKKRSAEFCDSVRQRKLGVPLADEHKAALQAGRNDYRITDEHRAKLSVAAVGRRHSEETKQLLRDKAIRRMTPEAKAKLSELAKNRKYSLETRLKMSAAKRGKSQSAEHIAKRFAHRNKEGE